MIPEEPPRATPLIDCHRDLGARLVSFAGWTMPVQYSGVVDEHMAVRTAVGLFDVSHMGEIEIRGPQAVALLQWLTPNDAAGLRPGRVQYSALTTERGTFVDDLLVYRLAPDRFLVVVNAANAGKALRWMQEHGARFDAEVRDRSEDYALLALQGPRAESVLARLTPANLGALRYYGFLPGAVAGADALISRTGYTGEDGFEMYLPPGAAPGVWRALLDAGREDGIRPAGLGARDTLRLEASMTLYGNDIDESVTVLEAGLEWIVKWDAGDFLGREALEAQRRQGVRRRLTGFRMTGRGIPRHGYPVRIGGAVVGQVTSGSFAPFLKTAIGLTYLPPEAREPGTPLGVVIRDRDAGAEVVPLPFYRRPKRPPAATPASQEATS